MPDNNDIDKRLALRERRKVRPSSAHSGNRIEQREERRRIMQQHIPSQKLKDADRVEHQVFRVKEEVGKGNNKGSQSPSLSIS